MRVDAAGLICLIAALFSAATALARITPQDYERVGITALPDVRADVPPV